MILRLNNRQAREAACKAVYACPDGFVFRLAEEKRSLDQSAKFHAICGDVAKQKEYMGKKRTAEQWKVLFVSGHAIATGNGAEVVCGLEGEYINIRESTARMGKARASSLLEYTLAWCAENEVRLMEAE